MYEILALTQIMSRDQFLDNFNSIILGLEVETGGAPPKHRSDGKNEFSLTIQRTIKQLKTIISLELLSIVDTTISKTITSCLLLQ
jgi:hypothetical protein